ncbi:MAG: hypothetical protein H0W22_01745, partial [Chloroflexi bacterium]|nr:hypothetical protein [Chloroflexota bacterium]
MTMMPEPWSNDRLDAAFDAVAGAHPTPTDAVAATMDRVRARSTPNSAWRPAFRQMAAVITVVVLVAASALVAGIASERQSDDRAVRLSSLPVIDVETLVDRQRNPGPEELVVRGWLARAPGDVDCTAVVDPHPLVPHCAENLVFLMARPEDPGDAPQPRGPNVVPAMRIDAHVEVDIPLGTPLEVLAVGHLDDRRAATCPAADQAACRTRFVVDRLVRPGSDLDRLPAPWRSRISPGRDPSQVIGSLEGVVGSVTVVSIGVVAEDRLVSIEPIVRDLPTDGFGVWVVRALVAGGPDPAALRTFLLPDVRRLAFVDGIVSEVTASGVVALTGPTPAPSEDRPAQTEILGLPVMSIADAIALRDAGADDRELAVRGWFSPIGPIPCPAPATWPVTPVEPNCPDQWVVLMAEPESLVTVTSDGFDGRSPTGPAIQIDLDDLDRRWQPRLPDLGPAEPVEIFVVGHFDDRRSFACPPAVQDECRDRFVVDRVDWVDGATQPSSVVGADDGRQTSTPAAVQAIVAEETPGDSLLSMAVVDGPTGIGRIEPSLGTGRGGFIDQAWVWVVRVLEGERSVTYLVVDGTNAIFEMDGEGVPIQVGGSPLPTPAPSPGAFATFRFDLVAPEGPVVRMVVSDASRRLIDARSATLDELGRPGPDTALGRLGVDELGPGILLVRWGGVVCDTALELVVEMSAQIHLRLRGVHPPCDAMGIGRGVVLTFADDLDPARVTTEDLRQAVAPLPTTV